MLTADRQALGRGVLCLAAGILAASCFAGPIAELHLSDAKDGPDIAGAVARRLYERSERYAVDRERPMISSLERPHPTLFGNCELRAAEAMLRGGDLQRFAFEAIVKLSDQRMRQAFEAPALDVLANRSPLLLQALDGCVRASLLAGVCGRYVMSAAAETRDGRRDAIARAQDGIARTAEAAYCLVGDGGHVTAPRSAR